LFTRAVDVAHMSWLIKNDLSNELADKQEDYYNIADVTWKNLQNEVIAWIHQNFGQASVSLDSTTIKIDKNKIREFLRGNQSIDQINCN
jgi:hypothetical protein